MLGASGLGLGALCFYGLGFGAKPGAIDRSVYVPVFFLDNEIALSYSFL